MKRILVLSTILVIFLLPFQQNDVKAQETNLPDYLEYDSFQKRYNEHLSELIYYMGVSYDSNNHYFNENIDLYRQAVNDTFDNTLLNDTLNTFLDGMQYFEKPIAFLNVADDLRERLFAKIKDYFKTEQANENYIKPSDLTFTTGVWKYLGLCGSNSNFPSYVLNPEYTLVNIDDTPHDHLTKLYWTDTRVYFQSSANACGGGGSFYQDYSTYNKSHVEIITGVLKQAGFRVVLKTDYKTELKPTVIAPPQQLTNIYNDTVNNFNDGQRFDQNYTPSVSPVLVCPDDEVELSYSDGSFYTKQRQALVLSPSETVEYNGVTCNLDFKFPVLELDDLTGVITANGVSLLPKVPEVPEGEYDYSLLTYIRNSYDYATSVIATGVNGLKSIVVGTSGLVTFSGSILGFLPPEFVALFVAGFSVALGLWVFKR